MHRGLRLKTQITAVGRSVHVLGKIHRQRGKVVTALKSILNHLDFFSSFSLVPSLIVLEITNLRVWRCRYQNACQMILRLNEIEF